MGIQVQLGAAEGAIQDGKFYLNNGKEDVDGSIRFSVDPITNTAVIEKRTNGVWQAGSFQTGASSVWVGRSVGIAGLGHHLATEAAEGNLHFHAHSEFKDGLTEEDTAIIFADFYSAYTPIQPDTSSEFTGKIYEYVDLSTSHSLIEIFYVKTGATPASATIRLQAWEGSNDTGHRFFDQSYPASQFLANTEVGMDLGGRVEYLNGVNYFFRMSSDEDFSLKTNGVGK